MKRHAPANQLRLSLSRPFDEAQNDRTSRDISDSLLRGRLRCNVTYRQILKSIQDSLCPCCGKRGFNIQNSIDRSLACG